MAFRTWGARDVYGWLPRAAGNPDYAYRANPNPACPFAGRDCDLRLRPRRAASYSGNALDVTGAHCGRHGAAAALVALGAVALTDGAAAGLAPEAAGAEIATADAGAARAGAIADVATMRSAMATDDAATGARDYRVRSTGDGQYRVSSAGAASVSSDIQVRELGEGRYNVRSDRMMGDQTLELCRPTSHSYCINYNGDGYQLQAERLQDGSFTPSNQYWRYRDARGHTLPDNFILPPDFAPTLAPDTP